MLIARMRRRYATRALIYTGDEPWLSCCSVLLLTLGYCDELPRAGTVSAYTSREGYC